MSRYDEIYECAPHYFGREPSRLVARFRQLIPEGARVLDIGVGQGRNAVSLACRGAVVLGIDTSRAGLEKWEVIGRNSFRRDGRIRTFLEAGEIVTLLPGYEILYHDESLGPEHRHRDGPPERHYLAQLLAKKAEPR